MARSTEVVGGARGALVVKRASGEDVAALVDEARRLEAAAHPGVVELLGSAETSDGWELRLAHGGRPLELVGSMPVAEVASFAAGIASTLADLHDVGIVHGRIDGSHVLIGGQGRAVLCGIGADPVGATPADDVAALGTVLASLLDAGAGMEPIPDRRWFGRRSWSGWEQRALLLLADQACADPPSRRPTAKRLAAAIAEAVPGAAATPVVTSPRHAAGQVAPARPRLAALAGALAAVVVIGAVGIHAGRPHKTATAVTSPMSVDVTASSSLDSHPAPVEPTTTTTTSAVPIRVDGTMLVVGDRRYQVGQAGDLVVVGDWDCAGGVTPALLRPSTGEVFVFTQWPTDDSVTVRAAARVPGAATPHVEAGADACPRLMVRRQDGSSVPVPTGRTA